MAYADDIVFFTQGINQFKRAIRKLSTWAEENNMEINERKSGTFIYKKRNFQYTLK